MKLSEMKDFVENEKVKTGGSSSNDKQKLAETYEELKDFSSDELMVRLIKEIEEQKNNGAFDYDGLKKAVESVRIYLPIQTYENIVRIIEELK